MDERRYYYHVTTRIAILRAIEGDRFLHREDVGRIWLIREMPSTYLPVIRRLCVGSEDAHYQEGRGHPQSDPRPDHLRLLGRDG